MGVTFFENSDTKVTIFLKTEKDITYPKKN
jgi:hypothetical protein